MRALFTLLLIYFLTGILQITEDSPFAKKDIGFSSETDATEIECIVSPEIGLFESFLENLEDQDNKIQAFSIKTTTLGNLPKNINRPNKGETSHVFKNILIFYTNLPPPDLFPHNCCFSEIF
ncbi:hypothetical protein [Draconibacterium halophilum]|uniref:Uncharacterized protein n=1 Tax=Draconibacterium halophilum TaxID=2706887 RepID=A0A6C0RAR5_9BACT|nr:hypothetical protein [Draconibacterium halophilum]QIA07096.1 hypothetical protein G0Q07_04840 [Draconibacterium halophilum]